MAIWILVFLETNRRSWILDIGKFCEKKKKKSCSFSEKSEKKKPKSVYYLWWKKEKCRKLWIVLFWAFLFLHLKRCGKKKRKKNIFLFENLKNNTEDHFVALLGRMLNFLSVKAFFPFFFVTVSKVVCFYCVFSKKKSKNRKKGWQNINSNRIFQSFGKSGFGDVGTLRSRPDCSIFDRKISLEF